MGNNSGTGFGFSIGGSGGGGTNTNIANSDLTLDANRTTDVGANTLTIDSGTTNIIQFNGSGDSVIIGGTNSYTMPTASGTTTGAVMQTNNASGRLGFIRGGFSIPFSMYMQGLSAFSEGVSTWHYPEPMSNNKFLALIRSSGIAGTTSLAEGWDQLTSTTLRSCTLGGTPVAAVLDTVNAWVSVLDNNGNLTPTVTVQLLAFSPSEGATTQLLPTELVTATSNATGDSNNKWYNLRNTTQSTVAVSGSDLIMPALKLSLEGALPEEFSFDVWLNGSAHFYLTAL
tara:strand:- start:130 stop:984 length:855 start_codon:yes stop_codon:yes gene_type:complete